MTNAAHRLAAAPISWGICEVPGWGAQLAPRRVLGEMRDLGIRATELGALGWLPTDTVELRALLEEFELSLIGGFVPLVLHDPAQREATLAAAHQAAATLSAAGGDRFVTAVVSGYDAWERPALTDDEWASLFGVMTELDKVVGDYGMVQVVHPHVDTLIETAAEFDRFLDSSDTAFTLDTGHLFLGGADPVMLARRCPERVGLVHLKDVAMTAAEGLLNDEATLMDSVQAGLFPSVGQGQVPIAATIDALEDAGYAGWYVLEQDIALLDGLPAEGEGPGLAVRASVDYLRSLSAFAPA